MRPEATGRKIGISAAIRKYGISRATIYRLLNDQKLVGYKFSNRTLLDEDVADVYFESLPRYVSNKSAM
jgi:hypothetical protein